MVEINNRREGLTIRIDPAITYMILLAISFLPDELFSPIIVFAGLLLLFLSLGRIKIYYLGIVAPLLIILFLGIPGIFQHESRHILRDITYALNPIALIFIGFRISRDEVMWPGLIKIIINTGILIAVFHLLKFTYQPGLLLKPIADIRLKAANPNVLIVGLSLVLGLFEKKLRIGTLFPKYFPRSIALIILFLSFVFSFSRTSLFLAIVMSFSILGWIGRINLKTLLTIVLVITCSVIIIMTAPKDDNTTFRGKIARTLEEITISDYKKYEDLNKNWRGYESYRALEEFKSGTALQKIFGHGFGALVELGMTMKLDGVDFQKIPILHNGYAYILIKTGIVGLISYLFFYANLMVIALKNKTSSVYDRLILSRLLLGSTLCLIFSMLVIGGMAEIHNSEYVIFLGFILAKLCDLK